MADWNAQRRAKKHKLKTQENKSWVDSKSPDHIVSKLADVKKKTYLEPHELFKKKKAK